MSPTNHAIICLYYYRNVREYHLIFEPSNLNAGGKVADWFNGVCWGIGPKHFQRQCMYFIGNPNKPQEEEMIC